MKQQARDKQAVREHPEEQWPVEKRLKRLEEHDERLEDRVRRAEQRLSELEQLLEEVVPRSR